MAKPKTFIKSISIDEAKRSHNCQHNSNHRICAGDMRVKLKTGRKIEYFCTECALETLIRDIDTLKKISGRLEENSLL